MNNLYQQLKTANPVPSSKGNLGQIKQLMNICKNANNPQAMLMSMVGQNPQIKSVIELVQQSGGEPKALFYKMAEQQGVNPDDILNQLK